MVLVTDLPTYTSVDTRYRAARAAKKWTQIWPFLPNPCWCSQLWRPQVGWGQLGSPESRFLYFQLQACEMIFLDCWECGIAVLCSIFVSESVESWRWVSLWFWFALPAPLLNAGLKRVSACVPRWPAGGVGDSCISLYVNTQHAFSILHLGSVTLCIYM